MLKNLAGKKVFCKFMNTDPIADFLTRIRNSVSAGKTSVSMPYSIIKESAAKILEEEKIIEKSRVDRTGKFPELMITLHTDSPPLTLKRISKPGRRFYQKASEIRTIRNGFGISIFTTSKGLMTGEKAKEAGVGGEILCEIY